MLDYMRTNLQAGCATIDVGRPCREVGLITTPYHRKNQVRHHVFTAENLHSRRLLLPHLNRALRLLMRLTAAELRADIASGALDDLTLGVIFIDNCCPTFVAEQAS